MHRQPWLLEFSKILQRTPSLVAKAFWGFRSSVVYRMSQYRLRCEDISHIIMHIIDGIMRTVWFMDTHDIVPPYVPQSRNLVNPFFPMALLDAGAAAMLPCRNKYEIALSFSKNSSMVVGFATNAKSDFGDSIKQEKYRTPQYPPDFAEGILFCIDDAAFQRKYGTTATNNCCRR